MSDSSRPEPHQSQAGKPQRGWLARLRNFEVRDAWWEFLDAWEVRRGLRLSTYGILAVVTLVLVVWLWFYPMWTKHNAVSMARQWIEAGHLDYAAEAVHKSLEADPHQPELWLIAAELARLNKQQAEQVEYAHRAAQVGGGEAKYVLEWASAALLADMTDVAEQALAELPETARAASSQAQRLLGELKRRAQDYNGASAHFETALKLDGACAIDEVPLGLCLISVGDAAARARGLKLLDKWAADPEWGAAALRLLLEDAVRHEEKTEALKWALALRGHSGCTYGDVPNCLQALAFADNEQFEEELARLEQRHKASPEEAAQLVGWLNQIGKADEALEWLKTLPEASVQRPPLAQGKAEALLKLGDWGRLRDWTAQGDWGANLDFLRWSYGLQAARANSDEKRAEELWQTLYNHALSNSAHALFAGSMLYSWGMVKEAEALWWRAAGQSGGVSYEALGALARQYQVSRDADGQFKVFRQLHSLRPQDDAVTNNFIFFAVLTGNREQMAEQLARENMQRNPGNVTFLATYAYVLVAQKRASEALGLIQSVLVKGGDSSAVQFAYGLALAATGEKEKARPILRGLDPSTLTLREVDLIDSLLDGGR